jgi:prolyl oligopeptidase
MLRFHLFPGGHIGLDEYGSPDDQNMRPYLEAYSPYHSLKQDVCYPAVLLISGDADTRCHPMHARKMAARLQGTTANKLVLLDYHHQRGHACLLPLSGRIDTLSNQLCFLLEALGLTLDQEDNLVAVQTTGLDAAAANSAVTCKYDASSGMSREEAGRK